MKIILNGETKFITQNLTIAMLLDELDLQNKRLAVEVNQIIIPFADHQNYILQNADTVEIVHAIGGG